MMLGTLKKNGEQNFIIFGPNKGNLGKSGHVVSCYALSVCSHPNSETVA